MRLERPRYREHAEAVVVAAMAAVVTELAAALTAGAAAAAAATGGAPAMTCAGGIGVGTGGALATEAINKPFVK